MIEFKDFKKYKWFYTSSGKLVVGGKNSAQNDELLKRIKESNIEFIVMHTSQPGSPFSVILEDIKKISKSDIEECAVFTASFSKAWKSRAKKAKVDVFKASQLYKSSGMKPGTWGVAGQIKQVQAELELVLAKQLGVLRAVPAGSIKNKKNIILRIIPGKIEKKDLLPKLEVEMPMHFSQEEMLSALPAGGIKTIKA